MPAVPPEERISPRETRYVDRTRAAENAAMELPSDVLLGAERSILVDALVGEYAARPVEPLWDTVALDIDDRAIFSTAGEAPVTNQFRVEISMVFRGATDAARGFWTNGASTNAPDEMKLAWQTQLTSSSDDYEIAGVRKMVAGLRENWFEAIRKNVADANAEIAQQRAAMRAAVESVVRPRQQRIAAFSGAASDLGIPLNAASATATRIPLRPKTLKLADVEAAARDGVDDMALESSIADSLITQISHFGAALERLPTSANRLAGHDEETLRDFLLFILNANWQGNVTGETFVGQGKTDLHLNWRGREAFIGECKFWHGSKKFGEAIDQLLTLYTVWRATRVALVLFIRDHRDATAVIEKAWATLQSHERFTGETQGAAPDIRTALMKAQSDSARLVTLAFIPVVIPQYETAQH